MAEDKDSDQEMDLDRGDLVEGEEPIVDTPEITQEDEDIALGPEEVAEAEEAVVVEAVKEETSIPKSRFDEVRNKAKEREEVLIARTRELEQQISRSTISTDLAEVEREIVSLTHEHSRLLSDGELDKAADVFNEIRAMDRKIALYQASAITENARTAAREDIKMDALVAKYEAEHAFFDPEGTTYNQDAVDEVLFLRRSFEQQGLSRTQSLSKAVAYVVKAIAPESEAPKKGLKEGDARNTDTISKKLAAARAQAPDTGDTGIASDKIGGTQAAAIMSMSQEEFAKLPEKELAKLRGDSN